MNVDGGWVIGMGGKSILVREFIEVLTHVRPGSGSHTGDVEARLAALESEGVTKELAFPNSVLALFGWPDKEMRERCFRIYNEHIAEVQERSNNRIYGVGLINWWDAEGARRTLRELKALGLKTFLMPLSPGKDDESKPIDFGSSAMDGVWEAIEEAQVPVSHHIGESPPSSPERIQSRHPRHAAVRGSVPRPVRQVRARGDPGPPSRTAGGLVRGWDQLGALGAAGRRAHQRRRSSTSPT